MSGDNQNLNSQEILSRIGKQPVTISSGVSITSEKSELIVKGPKGTETINVPKEVTVEILDTEVLIKATSFEKNTKALHGMVRSILDNAVIGVTKGHRKSLEVLGVGYRVEQKQKNIVLNVGYSHSVEIQPLDGVGFTVENNTIHVDGSNKQKVGEIAAQIRKVRPPNAYKEKGIKYIDEELHLKPGKAAATTGE